MSVQEHALLHYFWTDEQEYRSYVYLAILLADFVLVSNIKTETLSIKFEIFSSEQRGRF